MQFKYPTVEAIAEFNREEVSRNAEQYALEDETRLRKILQDVRKEGEGLPAKDALIKKASLLIFRITMVQPFHEANKRTAYVSTKAFLNANGFSIRTPKEEVFDLLEGIVFGRIDLNQVEAWVTKRIVEL